MDLDIPPTSCLDEAYLPMLSGGQYLEHRSLRWWILSLAGGAVVCDYESCLRDGFSQEDHDPDDKEDRRARSEAMR